MLSRSQYAAAVRRSKRDHAIRQAALRRLADRFSMTIPVGDSFYTMPGMAYHGHTFSCIEDALYPFDLEIIRAIRVFVPDVMPIVIRSMWQRADYGNVQKPFVLMRHGIARAVRDAPVLTHDFECEMPIHPRPGFLIPGRTIQQCRPNYLEVEWADRHNKPHGPDLPGEYIPFDWELYYSCSDAYAETDDSPMSTTDSLTSRERSSYAARFEFLDAKRKARRRQHAIEERRYERRDRERYYREIPSDVELKRIGFAPGIS